MFRLFWFTVEFGMIRTRRRPARLRRRPRLLAVRAARHASSGQAEMLDFDLLEVLRTPYRIDIVQPVYFVIDGFEALARDPRRRHRGDDRRGEGDGRPAARLRARGLTLR